MMQVAPDAETKIITVVLVMVLEDIDKGIGRLINIKRSRVCLKGPGSIMITGINGDTEAPGQSTSRCLIGELSPQ
jgi:hypothetical protein